MKQKPKIIAILLAYNASQTLEKFYRQFPKELVSDIILVDDASKDNTFWLAKKLRIKAFQNPINLGYGGNMKKTLNIALGLGADILIDIHPDGEYKTTAIPYALKEVQKGAKLVLGNRFDQIDQPLKSGMYVWKFIPIWLLNFLDRLILGIKVNDLHQGFRVYTKDLLSQVNFVQNSDNYLFSFELIAQAAFKKLKIAEVPVLTSYTGKKRGATLKNSIKYSLGTFKILLLFIFAKMGIRAKIFQEPKDL